MNRVNKGKEPERRSRGQGKGAAECDVTEMEPDDRSQGGPKGMKGEGRKAGKFARCLTYQPLLILSHNPPSSPVRYLQLLSFYR